MAQDEKAASADKGKGKESEKPETNGVNGLKAPEKDKDGKIVTDGVGAALPPGTFGETSTS